MPRGKSSVKTSDTLESLVAKIRNKFGKESAVIPGTDDARSEVRDVIQSGVHVVDRWVLGCGGFPLGRMTELYADEGVGKTHFAWTLMGAAIRSGALAIYGDLEDSYDSTRASTFGVDSSKVVLLQPMTLEEGLDESLFALQNAQHKGPILLVLDSIGGAQFANEQGAGFSENLQDNRAQKLGQFCRTVLKIAAQKQVHILLVNQTRMKRGVIFGDATTTPGGKAPKFAASVRIQLFGGKALKDQRGLHVGKTVTFVAVKNRFAPPFRKAKVRLDFEAGWDNLWSTINLAKDLKLISDGQKYTAEGYATAVAALAKEYPDRWADVPTELETTGSTEAEEDIYSKETGEVVDE